MHAQKARPSQRPMHPQHARSDDGRAFLPDPYDCRRAKARAGDGLAEALAEEYVTSATSAEPASVRSGDDVLAEEIGGPFTESSGAVEFARGVDASNPADAEQEPFPTANRLV